VFRLSGATGEGVAELLAAAVRALDAVDARRAGERVSLARAAPGAAPRAPDRREDRQRLPHRRRAACATPRSARSRARWRELVADGREVVLVSSGAIAVGSRRLGWSHPGHSIPEKQAAAAVGQIGLIETYRRRFARYGSRSRRSCSRAPGSSSASAS
jgi:hypothetical protein